ncbi:MAG: hypothetical protein HYS56_06190, partial [Candidatus Omnitrophica bacterium]|nr:hypothetical protein [Candidatus Omnitrophota bacterium]
KERRGRLLINSKIQLAYWKLILSSMFLTALILFACLYQFLDRLVLRNPNVAYEQSKAVLEIFEQTSFFLILAFPSITIALLIWSLLISNRIAGPLYHMERTLGRILVAEDFKMRIAVRKDDDLRELAEQINRLLEKVETTQRGRPQ